MALLLSGRLYIKLRVELPDFWGRKNIVAIHMRKMREDDALNEGATKLLDDLSDDGLGARIKHFS